VVNADMNMKVAALLSTLNAGKFIAVRGAVLSPPFLTHSGSHFEEFFFQNKTDFGKDCFLFLNFHHIFSFRFIDS
jgi:hypothetical protein